MIRHDRNMTPQFRGARAARVLAFCAIAVLPPAFMGAAHGEQKSDPMATAGEKAPGAKITKGEAMQAALKTLPGKVTDVTVERKKGKQVYVIEIVAEKDGSETDVLVDMETGAVLGIDR